jgi:hypothetical protein
MRVLLLVLIGAACGRNDSRPASTGSALPSAPGDAALAKAVVDAGIDAPPGPRLADLPKVDDLPTLTLAPVAAAKLSKSRKLNTDGFKLHAAKDHAGAMTKYTAALAEDPGNLLARYNLASAAVSSGDAARGLAILATFKQPDCRACVGILGHAKTDPEWATQRGVAAFLEITSDAKPDKPDVEPIAKQIAELIQGRGKIDGLAPYFHPRQPLLLKVSGREFARLATPTELRAWGKTAKAEAEPYIRVPSVISCKDSCCVFSFDPKECEGGCGSDMAYDLESVCLGGVGDVWFVESVGFYNYLSSMP